MSAAPGEEYLTRAVVFPLDPTPAQERLLRSYCGAARFAHNWALGQVKGNLSVRAEEREAGILDADLTPSQSWSAYSLGKEWNAAKYEAAPWWIEVSMHAFRSGVAAAAAALDNFRASKKGTRKGRTVGFPRFKSRDRAKPSVTFVEINHQASWFEAPDVMAGRTSPNGHRLRLMLPQSTPDREVQRRRDNLAWIHTTESTRRLARKVESGAATIQSVTISFTGGRWQAAVLVRYLVRPVLRPRPQRRGGSAASIGIDAGITHLATLSRPVPGLTDVHGHIANPRVLSQQLDRLAKLDRKLARTQTGSKNRTKLKQRRARLHGAVKKTRELELHRVTNALVHQFDIVAIEDLNVAGMANHKRHLGRALADVSLAELRRQLTYKTSDQGTTLVVVDRFYPSSKTCSACGAVRAKLPLAVRVFECSTCARSLDRDVNAAINIEAEGRRLLAATLDAVSTHHVAGLRPETRNADPRSGKTSVLTGTEALAAILNEDEKAEPRSSRLFPSPVDEAAA
jgi:putative transposase